MGKTEQIVHFPCWLAEVTSPSWATGSTVGNIPITCSRLSHCRTKLPHIVPIWNFRIRLWFSAEKTGGKVKRFSFVFLIKPVETPPFVKAFYY